MKSNIPITDIKKYGGKEVAILNSKIIVSGKMLPAVIKDLKKKRPAQSLREVTFLRVPESLTVIYHV